MPWTLRLRGAPASTSRSSGALPEAPCPYSGSRRRRPLGDLQASGKGSAAGHAPATAPPTRARGVGDAPASRPLAPTPSRGEPGTELRAKPEWPATLPPAGRGREPEPRLPCYWLDPRRPALSLRKGRRREP